MNWELPLLDATRCSGCGICVRVCPADCLVLAGPVPRLVRPMDCISCTLCVIVCPTRALIMALPEPA